MTDRQRLKEMWRPVASSIRTDEELRHLRASTVAINGDGTVNASSIINVLPWQRIDFQLPGAVAVGSWLGGIFAVPQGARIRHIAAYTRIAPSGDAFTATLLFGSTTETISIPQGEFGNATGASIDVPPGGSVRMNVTSAGGAEDVTVSLHYNIIEV